VGERPVRESRSERPARPPLRIALRLAARNARRSLGRSILIVAMMAIPVAGMSATAVVVASSNPTDRELVELHFADAKAILQVAGPSNWAVQQGSRTPIGQYYELAPLAELESEVEPAIDPRDVIDGRVLVVNTTYSTVQFGDYLRQVTVISGDMFAPELAGRYDIVSGSAPTDASEVAVSERLAESLELRIGDEVSLLPDETALTVVGIGRSSHADDRDSAVFASGELFPFDIDDLSRAQEAVFYALDDTILWDDVLALNEQGIVGTSPAIILGSGPHPGALPDDYFGNAYGFQGSYLMIAALIGGFLLVQVVLLAGAAFMVGARQQQRALAVVASVGAENGLLRSVVTANGVVLGALGAGLGTAIGIGAAAVVMAVTRTGSALQYPGFHLDPLLLGVIAAAAIGAGWLAAAIPARIATRIDIVSALRGARRPALPRTGAKRAAAVTALLGLVAILGGGLALVALAAIEGSRSELDTLATFAVGLGAVLMQVAMLLALPSLLRAIARATRRWGTSARLATRDTARNAGRTVPVAAVVMTTVFVSAFILAMMGSLQKQQESWWTPVAPMGSIFVDARYNDPVTGELLIRGDLDSLVEGVASIAKAPAVLVEGVRRTDYWGHDPVTGGPIVPPDGTMAVVVQPDPNQVCPLDVPNVIVPEGEDFDKFFDSLADNPLCDEGSSSRMRVGTTFSVADHIRVGPTDVLEAAIGEPLSSASKDMLERGGVVAIWPEYVQIGEVVIEFFDGQVVAVEGMGSPNNVPVRSERLPAVIQQLGDPIPGAILMLPETADRLGLEPTPSVVIAHPPFEAGQAEKDALVELSRSTGASPWVAWGSVQEGPPNIVGPTALILVSATAAIALAASAIALGLARIDGRRDDAILGAVGATRRLRRASGFWQALLLAGLGSLVGTALGVLGAGALALPGGPLPFAPPLVPLAIIGFAVPLAIAVGAWLFAGRGAPLPTDRSAIA
jgi:ABC-type lipoprotein release transport system permease subunit